jgi:uncharacterized protein
VQALITRVAVATQASPEDACRLLRKCIADLNVSYFAPITQMQLLLTKRCNLACSYCFQSGAHRAHDMASDIAKKAIDLLFDYGRVPGPLSVVFFGGEPSMAASTLRRTLEYASELAEARSRALRFAMTTNGTLLTRDIARYLALRRVRTLVSIDGLKRTHDSHRRYYTGASSYESVIVGIRILQDEGVEYGVRLTITPSNVDVLADDLNGLLQIGITSYMLGVCSGVPWSNQAMDKLLAQLETLYSVAADGTITLLEFDEPGQPGQAALYGCGAGRGVIAVSTTGELWCCARVLGIPSPVLKLGDVTLGIVQMRKRAILAGGKAAQRACEEAGLPADYRGWCYIENYVENGDPFKPSLWQYEVCKRVSEAHGRVARHCL